MSIRLYAQTRFIRSRPAAGRCCFFAVCLVLSLFASVRGIRAADLDFSDPTKLPPPPAHAIGFPSRDADLDALPGFQKPPPGYGEVPFYWWLGDPLTKERLTWQLDQLASPGGVSGLQINYAHSDQGGRSYGLTFPSEPPLFSSAWWELFGWFLGEAKKRGLTASLSDYTLCTPGQGWYTDEIIRENPDIHGAVLQSAVKDITDGKALTWQLPAHPLSVVAFRVRDGLLESDSRVDLRSLVEQGKVRWPATDGSWRLVAVCFQPVPLSIDPMNPLSGKKYIEKFFQRFEDRHPGEGGRGLNFFFSDELNLGVSGRLWNDRFADEFRRRKGYDLLPELAALFLDIGSHTPKVRLDYSDVRVALSEENFFRPLFEWHHSRGMIFGCDHGGRGRDVVEFGDYFRTQRWTTGPGNDSPRLTADVVKNKVASSIAHLYERPRAWLEGYYGSGWGTTPAELTDATFRNFVLGHNLLTLHGLYYATYGGFWEWAPPCNHFRMPYWAHMGEFLRCSERLSYLLSQGVHRCDVAVLYPVAPMEADLGGKESVDTAFAVGPQLFNEGIDFDYLDFESLDRAEIIDQKLCVSGEEYRVLILPAMRAVRFSTLLKALEFNRAGGIVMAIGALPEASDRVGRDDSELDAMVQEIFGVTAREAKTIKGLLLKNSSASGLGMLAPTTERLVEVIGQAISRDFALSGPRDPKRLAQVLHRKIGPRDVYLVLGAPKGSECFFRAQGKVEQWNPWTGQTTELPAISPSPEGTWVRMPLDSDDGQLIVFTPADVPFAIDQTDLDEVASIEEQNGQIIVQGYSRSGGVKSAVVRRGEQSVSLSGTAPDPAPVVALDGLWDFELKPTLDNRWGDFRIPASPTLISPEARRFRYAEETVPNPNWQAAGFNDSQWPETTCSFGPRFWKLGPLPDNLDATALEAKLTGLKQVDPSMPLDIGGKPYRWQPYEFSLRWGVEGDPGHQGYHGLKEQVSDEFIALGKRQFTSTGSSYQKETGGARYYLWSAVVSPRDVEGRALIGGMRPSSIWFRGERLVDTTRPVAIQAGANPLLLRYDTVGRGYFAMESMDAPQDAPRIPLAMRWYQKPGLLPFDPNPAARSRAGWYRFLSPPGLRSMKLVAHGKVRAWANGREIMVESGPTREDGAIEYKAALAQAELLSVPVALRIEQQPGCYAGAALPEPVSLECVPGRIPLGDWSKQSGLETYSGGAWYRRQVTLTPKQVSGKVRLELGEVAATAEVRVNGELAGIRVAPPWNVEITRFVKPGDNQIEILVFNTLANHYVTIPTRYRGSTRSGLIGPVRVETRPLVTLK